MQTTGVDKVRSGVKEARRRRRKRKVGRRSARDK